jgi:adenylate cyclase
MTTEGFKRKLTAILSADVKGYSRLMGEDEAATVRTVTAYREVMATLIENHRGRVVDSPGDNLLAEFTSVVDALRCAVEIQEELKARNAELPENRKMEFRIGINLGDVIVERERIYGDGVNVAARVEGLAEGGGICISGTVYDSVENKLALGYAYLGEHTVKNITKSVRVYRVLMDPGTAAPAVSRKKRPGLRRWQWPALAGVTVLFVGVGALTIWNFFFRPSPPSDDIASVEHMVFPLPNKPSIAVLPFNNLGGDPEQEYFSDGITNDIITDLSKFHELFVIASNTVFTFKGKPVKVKDVGRELGVRYVLEGSVQRTSEKVRVNAQLIDATTEHHLWAERYDRGLKDLFAVQDEIVQRIVTTLAVKVYAAERTRVMRKATDSLEAYDFVLRGMEYFSRRALSANAKAREMFERAIDLDSRYAAAYVGLGASHLQTANYGWTEFPNQALQQAHDFAQKALSLEESNASAHRLLGSVYLRRAQYDLATSELKRAIELNPNDARSRTDLGSIMLYSGQVDDAIHSLETGLRFDPNMGPGDFMELGLAYYLKGRYDDAIRTLERGVSRKPEFVGNHIALAAAYIQAGRSEDATRAAATVLRLHPFFELDWYGSMFRSPANRAAIIDGLRKAGLK